MDLYWIHDGDCSLVSGASPVQRCLQAGDKETGITVRITINWGWGSNHHGQAWGFANQPNFGIYRIMKHIYIYIYICSIGKPTGEKLEKKTTVWGNVCQSQGTADGVVTFVFKHNVFGG